ncbi:hypothetical protein JMUB7533_26640 [Staphylococcus aureus]
MCIRDSGKGVAEGDKSLAISLSLQDTSRTLEEEEIAATIANTNEALNCLLYTSPSPRDMRRSRMPSSA